MGAHSIDVATLVVDRADATQATRHCRGARDDRRVDAPWDPGPAEFWLRCSSVHARRSSRWTSRCSRRRAGARRPRDGPRTMRSSARWSSGRAPSRTRASGTRRSSWSTHGGRSGATMRRSTTSAMSTARCLRTRFSSRGSCTRSCRLGAIRPSSTGAWRRIEALCAGPCCCVGVRAQSSLGLLRRAQ